ncbi:MAG TPA: nucleotide sugar dehydrogenase, partial [Anaerolineae bacterium]|nr:nucleotide sugar dehydrogenase [Anaerolineae bacterium]
MSEREEGVVLLEHLWRRIENKEAIIGIIGLGYVGLPVAATFADAGFSVTGVDIKSSRVDQINNGQNPIGGQEPGLAALLATAVASSRLRATDDYRALAEADVILIDVETPVDESHRPQYVALRSACKELAGIMKRGALVVVESTVAPGTIDRVVRPLLEQYSGRQSASEFFIGACPERVMPGKLLRNLRTMSRVCGGETPEVAQLMVAFYRQIVEAELDLADPVTAELVKTTENAYRDVQIAFANEVALICEAVGADIWQVRDLVNKVPFRHMHLPGAGVGGHCIPKDPWLLASAADESTPARLIPQARAVNDGMPHHVAELTLEALRTEGLDVSEARVVVLGYAYLENSWIISSPIIKGGKNILQRLLQTFVVMTKRPVEFFD